MTELPMSMIVLEYVKTLVNWPLAVFILVITQRKAIERFAERLTRLKAAGVEMEAPQYLPLSDKTDGDKIFETTESPSSTDTRLESLARDFNVLLYRNFLSNLMMIDHMANLLWKKNFWERLHDQNKRPDAVDKAKSILQNEDAKKDLDTIRRVYSSVTKEGRFDRKEMIGAYLKSESIVEYLREFSAKAAF